ncbi:hypothetical protein [Flavobacterium sp.]|uniref:hypothetical protein n=1 Tax=Flavobacterium sp. TaxID=239 RepID=UPI0026209E01|nr:hypothetical protein [Flavobacterium sp.]
MEINWIIISVVVIFAILLILFLIKRNLKDEKDLEVFLKNNDLPIEKEEDDDEVNNNL